MPEQQLKSSEIIQAQVAAFTAERVEHFEDRKYVYQNIGDIALGNLANVERITERHEYHEDESGKLARVEEGTVRKVATSDEYVDFLRSVNGSEYDGIKVRAELLEAYSSFKPTVEKLREELADPATRKQHPDFLGSGTNSMAFTIQHHGSKYAVRVPVGKDINPTTIDSHMAGAVLARDIPHMEHIVAASYEDGVTVAEIVPGKELDKVSIDDLSQVTDRQLSDFVDTLIMVNKKGITIDPKPSNFFYDTNEGYGIVDYHSSKQANKNSTDQKLGEVISWIGSVIRDSGDLGGYKINKTAEEYEKQLRFMKASHGILKRFSVIVNEKLSEDDKVEALRSIHATIDSLEAEVINPNWVTDRIARDIEMAERREKMAAQSASDGWDFV